MKYSKWWGIYCCSECEAKLTDDEVIYSSGVCPKCGAISEGSDVRCIKRAVRNVFPDNWKWWKVWIPHSVEIKEDNCEV